MAAHSLILLHLLFACLGRCQYDTNEIFIDPAKHDEEFFTFPSRPDIEAPRWDSKVYNASALAPGEWFISPYTIVEQVTNEHEFVSPAIYDSKTGELIWNGGREFDYRDVFSLQVVNFDSQRMLSFLQPEAGHGVIMNNHYSPVRHVRTGNSGLTGNMHEFQVVDDGTKALFLTTHRRPVPPEKSLYFGFEGECIVNFLGFEERDINTDEIIFSWDSETHVDFSESYVHPIPEGFPEYDNARDCGTRFGVDYIHGNSIEKLPDGDYLLSCRATYTIYKISHIDGSIVWRLGGKNSDFTFAEGVHFSAQHDARCLHQDGARMTISLMDNAVGVWEAVGYTSNPNSRGLVLSLNTETMVATEIAHYDHPDGPGGYAFERGSVQTLPNGNVFVTWTLNAHHSEYTADGTLIAEAKLISPLKTYRSFKFPWWNGHARLKPDVYSEVVADEADGELRTVVRVSWNGDTLAARWSLYETDVHGESAELLNKTDKAGFETEITYKGYLPFVKVDAVDKDGARLDKSASDPTRTVFLPEAGAVSIDPPVKAEAAGIDDPALSVDPPIPSHGAWNNLGDIPASSVLVVPTNSFLVFFGGVLSVLLLLNFRKIRWPNLFQRMRGGVLYSALADDDEKGAPA